MEKLYKSSNQIEYNLNCLITMDLAFFNQAGEKTEKATPKKRQKAREEGQVVQSTELGTAVMLITVFIAVRIFIPMMVERMMRAIYGNFTAQNLVVDFFNTQFMARYIWSMFGEVLLIFLPLGVVSMAVGLLVNILQVGWKPTAKTLKPKFSKLNPISGIKRTFSLKMFVELAKSLLKFGVVIVVVYTVLSEQINMLGMLPYMDLISSVIFIGDLIATVGMTVGILYIFVAALDYFFNRRKHEKELRMSKQEVKEEWKQMEGDPQIKNQIKQKMREVSMRRMMQDVPGTDVVITNPTHFAVAIRYDKASGEAPIVVAKGGDFMAKRIKEKAQENGVAVIENKPLARTLFATVEINDQIPPQLYQAVAEVLAYVYKLKNSTSFA